MGWVDPFIRGELIGDVGFIKPSNIVTIPLKPLELIFGRYYGLFISKNTPEFKLYIHSHFFFLK